LQLEKQLNNLRDREKRLTQQLNEQSSRNQSSGEIIITVQSKSSTNIELNLSYIVSNAGWMPIYDLRAKDTKSPIALAYRANVYQNTGIDWKNVKLTLSTANPSQGGSKAELYPQYLSVYEPQPIYVQNSRAMKKEAPQAMAMEAAPMVSMADAGTTASLVNVQESTMSVNFEIQIPYSIPSSGNPELVDIQNHSLSADYKYSIAPKVDKDAFLVSIIRDWEKLNLLPGKANVYFEGTFVGETQINGSDVADSLVISLGRDKKIVSKREVVSEYKARKTVGSNIRETFGYKISLRNTKGEAITLTVEDQIPVSQDSRIEVELEDAKGAAFQTETGKLTWNVTLQPQESKEIIVVYNVKYPKGKQINNL
jgi:uncharacterized protein (TIGR02231 family)